VLSCGKAVWGEAWNWKRGREKKKMPSGLRAFYSFEGKKERKREKEGKRPARAGLREGRDNEVKKRVSIILIPLITRRWGKRKRKGKGVRTNSLKRTRKNVSTMRPRCSSIKAIGKKKKRGARGIPGSGGEKKNPADKRDHGKEGPLWKNFFKCGRKEGGERFFLKMAEFEDKKKEWFTLFD